MQKNKNEKCLEELPFREYLMYAFGASHAKDFEEYKKEFKEIFLGENEDKNDDVKPAM
jgi:hypothetical protein